MFLLRFACGAVLGVPAGSHGPPVPWLSCVTTGVAWFLATVYVYLVNGVEDATADRLNGVGRPIGRGELDPVSARRVARFCAAGALALAVPGGAWAVAAVVAYLVLGHLYSVPPARLSATPFGALVVVLGGVSLTYAAGAVSIGCPPDRDGLVFAVVMTLWTTLVGATAKDLSDLRGDVAAGRRTLVARLSRRQVRRGVGLTALVLGGALCVAGIGEPELRLPGAVTLAGAGVVTHRLGAAVAAADRDRARAPYRAFMVTQFAAHALVLAERLTAGGVVS